MDIRTIPLSHLEANPHKTLRECADSGATMLIELPDRRFVALQPLEPVVDDDLVNQLLASNQAFHALVEKSIASPRKPF